MKTTASSNPRHTAFAILGVGCFLVFAGYMLLAATTPPSEANQPTNPERYVYVGGYVEKPGRYIFTNGITVTGAHKLAGIKTPWVSLTLIRDKGEMRTIRRKQLEKDKTLDIQLRPNDRIYVRGYEW